MDSVELKKQKARERAKLWYQNNKEKAKEYRIEYRILNGERINQKLREERKNNPEKIREREREQYHKDIEKSREQATIYRKRTKDKRNEYGRKYRYKDIEKTRRQARERYYKDIEKTRRNSRDNRRKHSTKLNKKLRDKRSIGRIQAILHYSPKGVCVRCGEDRIDGFTFDIIDGGGKKTHQKEGSDFARNLKKNGYPNGIQILCSNCQHDKIVTNNEHHSFKEIKEIRVMWEDNLKWKTFSFYSNSKIPFCKICGRTYLWHLCLDHIKGGGGEDRKKGWGTGIGFYSKLRKLGFPRKDELQVLCHTCNTIKHKTNKEFVHKN